MKGSLSGRDPVLRTQVESRCGERRCHRSQCIRCRLAGDDYIIEGANRFIYVVHDRAADELVRAVSLPNQLQIDYDQIDAHGSDVVALQCYAPSFVALSSDAKPGLTISE
jgi:hypothetical protein